MRFFKSSCSVLTGALSFVYLIFVLNPIQMASALIYPFSRPLCRRINRWCARSIWGLWVLMGERQFGIDVRFTGDAIVPRENALVLPNHQSMADVFVAMAFAWRCGRLGDTKWFVKDIMKYIPGPGWGMKFLDCVFLKRDWARDRASVERLFEKYKKEEIPIFLVSFLEGTRRTPAKLQRSRAFAVERGLHVPEWTLTPRTKGFVATMIGLRTHLDAVYDLTIRYATEPAPMLVSCFWGKVRRVDVHVRRYPVDAVPQGDDAATAWVYERFLEKDQLLRDFAVKGCFPGPTVAGPVQVCDWFRSERLTAVAAS